jgi:hypothetical protein
MCQVKVFRPVHSLVIIPVDKAIYCKACKSITNSPSDAAANVEASLSCALPV